MRTDLQSSLNPKLSNSPATSTQFQDSLSHLTSLPHPNLETDQDEAIRKKKSFGLKLRSEFYHQIKSFGDGHQVISSTFKIALIYRNLFAFDRLTWIEKNIFRIYFSYFHYDLVKAEYKLY